MIIRKLIWDEWNIEHIARHNVTPEEVEETCKSKRQSITKAVSKIRVIGQTSDGRYLTIFLAPRGRGNYYPVTARDATAREKRRLKKK